MKNIPNIIKGPLLVGIASSLWAFDSLFRAQLSQEINFTSILFYEHLLGFIFLSPFLYKYRSPITKISKLTWLKILLVSLISSVSGGILFTFALQNSFSVNDFTSPVLLQKLQPIIVIILSSILLKEKISLRFLILVIFALIGSYLMTFGNKIVGTEFSQKELIFVLSIGAATCWGLGTILSKSILNSMPHGLATVLRYLFGIPFSLMYVLLLSNLYSPLNFTVSQSIRLIAIAMVTGGAIAIFIYYYGLKFTAAKVATFAELMLPTVTIIIATTSLNPYGEPQILDFFQISGIFILIVSILLISIFENKKEVDKNLPQT